MNTWSPTTCACIIADYNSRSEFLLQRCRTHNTVKEARDHNHKFPNEPDQDRERKKPIYQRR